MINLPRRPLTIDVQLQDEPRVVATLATLTTAEAMEMRELGTVEISTNAEGEKEVVVRWSPAVLIAWLTPRIRAVVVHPAEPEPAKAVQVEGEPFDAAAEGHVDALPRGWMSMMGARLVNEALSIPKDVAGNSTPPAARSRTGGRRGTGAPSASSA